MNNSNIAFIDGQNLYLGAKKTGWKIDLKKFRIYLRDKYNVKTAYYFLGYKEEVHSQLYSNLDLAGFKLIFKAPYQSLKTIKKECRYKDCI